MLHGYKKSRYNIYNNLEFLGLNPYELKHFCFGEGESGDDAGGDYDSSIANAVAAAQAAAQAGMPSVDFFDKQGLSDPTKGAIGPGQPDQPDSPRLVYQQAQTGGQSTFQRAVR